MENVPPNVAWTIRNLRRYGQKYKIPTKLGKELTFHKEPVVQEQQSSQQLQAASIVTDSIHSSSSIITENMTPEEGSHNMENDNAEHAKENSPHQELYIEQTHRSLEAIQHTHVMPQFQHAEVHASDNIDDEQVLQRDQTYGYPDRGLGSSHQEATDQYTERDMNASPRSARSYESSPRRRSPERPLSVEHDESQYPPIHQPYKYNHPHTEYNAYHSDTDSSSSESDRDPVDDTQGAYDTLVLQYIPKPNTSKVQVYRDPTGDIQTLLDAEQTQPEDNHSISTESNEDAFRHIETNEASASEIVHDHAHEYTSSKVLELQSQRCSPVDSQLDHSAPGSEHMVIPDSTNTTKFHSPSHYDTKYPEDLPLAPSESIANREAYINHVSDDSSSGDELEKNFLASLERTDLILPPPPAPAPPETDPFEPVDSVIDPFAVFGFGSMATEPILQYCAPVTPQKLSEPIKKKASGCLFGFTDDPSEQVEGTPEKKDRCQSPPHIHKENIAQLRALEPILE